MYEKTRRIAAALAATAVALLAVGCNKQENKAENSTDTLVWMLPCEKQSDLQSVLDEVNKITEEKVGASLDIQFIDTSAFTERMTMNMASGTNFAFALRVI